MKYKEQIKIFIDKLRSSPYFFPALFFIAILLMLFTAVIIKKQTTTSQPYSGTIEVDSRIPGSQFIYYDHVYYTPVTIENVIEGTHVITAHNAGYVDESLSVTVNPGETTKVFLKMEDQPTITTPSGIPGPDDIGEQEDALINANKLNQLIENRKTKYPFTQYLPEVIGSIMLDYDVNQDESVQYVVRPLPDETYSRADYQQRIDDFIRSKGFDPSSLQVLWKTPSGYKYLDYQDNKQKLKYVHPSYTMIMEQPNGPLTGYEYVALVKSISIDSRGNGSIEILESSPNALPKTYTISSWEIKNTSYPVKGFSGK